MIFSNLLTLLFSGVCVIEYSDTEYSATQHKFEISKAPDDIILTGAFTFILSDALRSA